MTEYYDFNEHIPNAAPRMTWAAQRIILLNIIVFALQIVTDPLIAFFSSDINVPMGHFLTYWLAFNPRAFMQGWIWMPVTYQFLHGGILHLFFNMLWLYFCAPEVERTLGTRQFYRFYLFCGTVSVLPNLIPYFMRGTTIPIIGASGAVMAVVVAFAMLHPNRKFYLIPIPFPISAKGMVVIFLVLNLLYSRSDSPVAWLTHLSGMGLGYLYMKLLPRWNKLRREKRAQKKAARDAVKKEKVDHVGEAVDNIFQFDDKDRK